jgi:hypothetical protein
MLEPYVRGGALPFGLNPDELSGDDPSADDAATANDTPAGNTG